MSELAELETFLQQHGKPVGTRVEPYQARDRSPWDERLDPPPEVRAAVREFMPLANAGRARVLPGGTIAYADDVDQSVRDRLAAAEVVWAAYIERTIEAMQGAGQRPR